jgi:hypothetical protein
LLGNKKPTDLKQKPLYCYKKYLKVIIIMSMLRPIFSVAGRNGPTASAVAATTTRRSAVAAASRSFATQSGDDTEPPTAMAKLHLEDGTTLTARSFGCHTSVEGEVSKAIF